MLVKTLIPKMQSYYSSSRGRFSRDTTAVASEHSNKVPFSPRDKHIALTEPSHNSSTVHSRANSRAHTHTVKPWNWFLKSRSRKASREQDLEAMNNNHNMSNNRSTVHVLVAQQDPETSSRPSTIEKENDKIYVKRDYSTKETFLVSKDGSMDLDRELELDYINACPVVGDRVGR